VRRPPRRARSTTRGAFVALVALVATACGTSGSGDVVTEFRDIGAFAAIDVGSGIAVELTVDSGAAPAVSVTFDDNLVDRLVTSVEGSTLVIEFDGSFRTSGSGPMVAVTAVRIESLEASGGSSVTGTGAVDAYRVRASGGSSVNLRDLDAATVEVDASGGSRVVVFAAASVSGEASGGSSVDVYGTPASSSVAESGGAEVIIHP